MDYNSLLQLYHTLLYDFYILDCVQIETEKRLLEDLLIDLTDHPVIQAMINFACCFYFFVLLLENVCRTTMYTGKVWYSDISCTVLESIGKTVAQCSIC